MSAPFPSVNTLPMRELNVSNHLLGDRAALNAAWERDGYWFFRDVIDQGALARLREVYLKCLREDGVIDPNVTDAAVYNGASLDKVRVGRTGTPELVAADPLVPLNPKAEFLADPAIHKLFSELLGDEPFWVPISEYRVEQPNRDRNRSRFSFIHCDCSHNAGIPFVLFWIPVAAIDEETGGLAVAEGLHHPDSIARPPEGIPLEWFPPDVWRRAAYRPGDLLMFDKNTPHSGLANYSSRYFRLSMDLRAVRASENVPTVGHIAAVGPDSVTVKTDNGSMKTFKVDADSYCRSYDGVKIPLAEIQARLKVGSSVIVGAENGVAKVVRPQH